MGKYNKLKKIRFILKVRENIGLSVIVLSFFSFFLLGIFDELKSKMLITNLQYNLLYLSPAVITANNCFFIATFIPEHNKKIEQLKRITQRIKDKKSIY